MHQKDQSANSFRLLGLAKGMRHEFGRVTNNCLGINQSLMYIFIQKGISILNTLNGRYAGLADGSQACGAGDSEEA
jgi:hypothetical protein